MSVTTQTHYLALHLAGERSYFGPVVACALRIDAPAASALTKLSIPRIHPTTVEIERSGDRVLRIVSAEIVCISPERYNQLIAKLDRGSRIAAWALARAVDTMMGCYQGLASVHISNTELADDLSEAMEARHIKLAVERADENSPATIAARTVARSRFLQNLRQLEDQEHWSLPLKEEEFEAAGHHILSKGGLAALARVAKLDFPLTAKLTHPELAR